MESVPPPPPPPLPLSLYSGLDSTSPRARVPQHAPPQCRSRVVPLTGRHSDSVATLPPTVWDGCATSGRDSIYCLQDLLTQEQHSWERLLSNNLANKNQNGYKFCCIQNTMWKNNCYFTEKINLSALCTLSLHAHSACMSASGTAGSKW